jgi:general secretion pathway protein G
LQAAEELTTAAKFTGFVSGHGFSRAEEAKKGTGALAPAERNCMTVKIKLKDSRSTGRRTVHRNRQHEAGFTLIELIIVMTIIGVLATLAIPSYVSAIKHAREAVLKEDLHVMRAAIDSYTMDKQKAPQALDDLVQAGYLKIIPEDPMTHSKDTWATNTSDAMYSLDQTDPGIDDVHSGAQDTGSDGQPYSSW